MKNAALIISFCFLQTASLTGHKDLYVSVNGNDENPGTRTKPFLTLAKAQNSLRELIASGRDKKITVWLDEGIYRLEKTLVFGPEDSDNKAAVTYSALPGKNVEISGGKEIKDWEKRDGGIWVAHCEVPGNYDFREMFIDGKRAIRARHPNNGFLRIVQAGKDRRTNFFYNEDDFPVPEDPSGVELILLHDWSVTRIAVSGIDNSKHLLSAKDTIGARRIDFFKIDNWEKNPRYFLENSIAFLDSEKEYFYDRKEGLVYLKLKEGESPKEMRIVVPFVESGLIRMDGDENHRISNVHFENIDFKYCYWPIPREGYAGIQACSFDPRGEKIDGWSVVPAAVKGTYCENCSFEKCRFTNLGGSGLWLSTGCRNCLISGCFFEDISGNGIMIGEGNDRMIGNELWWKKSPDQAARSNRVENSTIDACGKQFFGAVGVWCGLAAQTTIYNNHIHDLPYTGISIGWLWNPDPTPCRENRIENNHIHDVMQVLSDGGGIYSLGLQPASRIIHNHIHDIPLNAGRAESNGMFLDEGTTDVEISNNLVYNIAKSPLRFHKATKNLVKNNVLGCSGDNPPVRYNRTPVENIILENNQVLNESDPEHKKILNTAIETWRKDSSRFTP